MRLTTWSGSVIETKDYGASVWWRWALGWVRFWLSADTAADDGDDMMGAQMKSYRVTVKHLQQTIHAYKDEHLLFEWTTKATESLMAAKDTIDHLRRLSASALEATFEAGSGTITIEVTAADAAGE